MATFSRRCHSKSNLQRIDNYFKNDRSYYPDQVTQIISKIKKEKYRYQIDDIKYLYSLILKYTKPNVFIYSSLISFSCKFNYLNLVRYFYDQMTHDGLRPNVITYNSLIKAYSGNDINEVKRFYDQMTREGLKPSVITYSSLIEAYSNHDINEVKKYYDQMIIEGLKPDVITYSSLIEAYSTHDINEVKKYYDQMIADGLKPNVITYSSLIKACSDNECINQVKRFYNQMISERLKPDVIIYNSLIKAYSKHDDINEVKKYYDQMITDGLKPSVITYNSLITAYSSHNINEVKKYYDQMTSDGLKPNQITYNSLILACVINKCPKQAETFYYELKEQGLNLVQISSNEIDVHGMSRHVLQLYLQENEKIFKDNPIFSIICGRGKHSQGDPVLKQTIIDFCDEKGIQYNEEANGGKIVMTN